MSKLEIVLLTITDLQQRSPRCSSRFYYYSRLFYIFHICGTRPSKEIWYHAAAGFARTQGEGQRHGASKDWVELQVRALNASSHCTARYCQGVDPGEGGTFITVTRGQVGSLLCCFYHDYRMRRAQRCEPSTSDSCMYPDPSFLLHVLYNLVS